MSAGRRTVLARTVALHGAVGAGPVVPGEGLEIVDRTGAVTPRTVAAAAAAGAHVLCADGFPELELEREHAALLHALGLQAGAVRVPSGCGPPTLPGVLDDPAVLPWEGTVGAAALADALGGGARRTRALDAAAPVVLHVEGVGPVVGGILRGTLRVGAAVTVLPSGEAAVVSALRVRGRDTDRAVAGDRATVTLNASVAAGDALVGPTAALRATRVLDVAMGDRVRLPHAETVEVLAGARCSPAEVGWLGGRFHQLRCEHEVLVAPWDRVVVRSAGEGLLGGDVLDPGARRHGPSREVVADLTRRARGDQRTR